jgi:putative acetyltransferase
VDRAHHLGQPVDMATITVQPAQTAADFDAVRALIRAFVAWHGRTHPNYRHLLDRYFNTPAFEAELASLPEHYAAPHGALLLARADGRPAGCVAFHAYRDGGDCEMKRMFVPDEFRGLGVGRALGGGIVGAARDGGYRRMLLETSRDQRDAIRLYEKIGFVPIPPYYDAPADLAAWLVYFAKEL